MWAFSLNSSSASKDFFFKNRICHAMQCILGKIILEKIFICMVNSTCNLYALLGWQKFMIAKRGCYRHLPWLALTPER
jgi:hypothetical protein